MIPFKQVYFVRNTTIFKGIIQKKSRRGTAVWIKPVGTERERNILVSYSKIFKTFKEAKEFIKFKEEIKKHKEERSKRLISKNMKYLKERW